MKLILVIFIIFIAIILAEDIDDSHTMVSEVTNLDIKVGKEEYDRYFILSHLASGFKFNDCGEISDRWEIFSSYYPRRVLFERRCFTAGKYISTSPTSVNFHVQQCDRNRKFQIFAEKIKGEWKYTKANATDCDRDS